MLWEVAPVAETYSRQVQRRQYSERGKVSLPLPKPASTPLPCCALALIWGISVTLHHSYTLGPKENSLPALTPHIYCIITNAHIHTGSTRFGVTLRPRCNTAHRNLTLVHRIHSNTASQGDQDWLIVHTPTGTNVSIPSTVSLAKENCRVWEMWYGREVTKICTSLHAGIIFHLLQQRTNMDNREWGKVQSYFAKTPAVFYSIKYINTHNTDISWFATPANTEQGNKKET